MGSVVAAGGDGSGGGGVRPGKLTAHVRGFLRHVADQCGPCLKAQEVAVSRAMQNEQHPGYVARDQPYDCAQCVAVHQNLHEFPGLASERNRQAWDLYATLQGQLRSGGMDVMGLDFAVLPVVWDVYDVPRGAARRDLFERLVLVDREMLAHQARKREIAEAQAKAKGGRH